MPGQSVLVEALDPDGSPLKDQAGTVVRINGITGARQFLQFPRAGDHVIRVAAWREGDGTDRAEVTFPVVGDAIELPEHDSGFHVRALSLEPATGVPMLRIAHTPGSPTTVGLSVGRGPRFPAGLTTRLGRPSDEMRLLSTIQSNPRQTDGNDGAVPNTRLRRFRKAVVASEASERHAPRVAAT